MKRKLQVFISSTYTDLIEERQAAVAAVLKAGHIPAGMELFTAGDRSQMSTIKEWIDESDVYMLILGGRYGSIEKTTGVSYTELEYEYALEQNKASFAVVITEAALEAKVRAKGTSFTEKENPKELALFRQKALSNVSSFFDDHKDIKLCVHESLADFSANRELKGWVSGDEIIDTKPLFDEIKRLTEENRSLIDTVAELHRKGKTALPKNVSQEQYADLRKMLSAIDIKIPAELTTDKAEMTMRLFDIFYANKDVLINGVTNSLNASPTEIFYYHNVAPKLQVHGLTINEKVPGTQYRRSYVSPSGAMFLAAMDKLRFLAKSKSFTENISPAGDTER